MACGLALRVGPADPGVARPQMESGAGPTQQADPFPVLLDDITERLTDQTMFFEIMMLADQFIPASLILQVINELNRYSFGSSLSKDFADDFLRS